MSDTPRTKRTKEEQERNTVASTDLLAWFVEVNDRRCVVFAATAAKARWVAVMGFWDAGYGRGPGTWPSVKSWRATQYDRSRLRTGPRQPWGEDYVQDCGTW